MHKRWFRSLLTVGTVAITSYNYGIYLEHQRSCNTNNGKCDCQRNENPDKGFLKLIRENYVPEVDIVTAAVPAPLEDVPLTASPLRTSQIMKHGFPSLDNIRSYSDYILSYDRRNRVANWVFEHLTADLLEKNDEVDRSKCEFKADQSIHPYFQSQNTDYFRSGYDRGHLAAAGNHHRHQKHCEDTFYLTNMAPQVGKGFNRDTWNRLEKHVRKLVHIYTDVYVCTGPLYLPRIEADGKKYVKYEVIGSNNVAVPTHFYKVILGQTAQNTYEMESYVMPNQAIDDDTPLQVFQVPLESIERSSGLLFYDRLNKKQLKKINGQKV